MGDADQLIVVDSLEVSMAISLTPDGFSVDARAIMRTPYGNQDMDITSDKRIGGQDTITVRFTVPGLTEQMAEKLYLARIHAALKSGGSTG